MSEDGTAAVSLSRMVHLELADSYVLGWKAMVCAELDRMRMLMPYADTLVLRLECERRPLM